MRKHTLPKMHENDTEAEIMYFDFGDDFPEIGSDWLVSCGGNPFTVNDDLSDYMPLDEDDDENEDAERETGEDFYNRMHEIAREYISDKPTGDDYEYMDKTVDAWNIAYSFHVWSDRAAPEEYYSRYDSFVAAVKIAANGDTTYIAKIDEHDTIIDASRVEVRVADGNITVTRNGVNADAYDYCKERYE